MYSEAERQLNLMHAERRIDRDLGSSGARQKTNISKAQSTLDLPSEADAIEVCPVSYSISVQSSNS
jgi:hypothetical protein